MSEGAEFLLVFCADVFGEHAVDVVHHGLQVLLQLGRGGLFALGGHDEFGLVLAGGLAACFFAGGGAGGGFFFGDAARGRGALFLGAGREHD